MHVYLCRRLSLEHCGVRPPTDKISQLQTLSLLLQLRPSQSSGEKQRTKVLSVVLLNFPMCALYPSHLKYMRALTQTPTVE